MLSARIDPESRAAIARAHENAPVNVAQVAADLGVRAYAEPLPAGVSGKLYRDMSARSGWSLSVNNREVGTRQRFTAAHELGHFLLHRGLVNESVVDDTYYRSGLSSRQETEANEFAADLLMPWSLIQKLTAAGVTTAEGLAEALQVSQVAMNIRLGIPT